MANKKQFNDLKTSLKTIQEIDWFDGIHQLPDNIDKQLLDECSNIIQEFIDSSQSISKKIIKPKVKVKKRQVSKVKKSKIKVRRQSKLNKKPQKIKAKVKKLKKNTQSFNYANTSSTNGYPCYPSAFPCFRSCGPINCPKNKLPMPRDLWYRIVYSQALEQQLGSGDTFSPRIRPDIQSSSKRNYIEDGSVIENLQNNKSNSNNPRQQQTMNAVISLTSTKLIKPNVVDHLHQSECNQENLQLTSSNSYKPYLVDNLEYIPEILPLEAEDKHSQLDVIHTNSKSKENLRRKIILSTQSADAKLINRPKIYRGLSADGKLEQILPILNSSSASILLNNQSNFEENISLPTNKNIDNNPSTDSSFLFEHPLINQLSEYYNLETIPRVQLFKRLNHRLKHIHQILKTLSRNDIEVKLIYKRDALVKKRQTPVQSLTNDEKIAMVELEINVYEYVQALDQSSATSPYETISPVVKTTMILESLMTPSVSAVNTVRPSPINQSTALLSTTTQFNDKTEKFPSWTHPLESILMNNFEQLTPLHKAQIHKRLARRYEHICKRAQVLDNIQLQAQIDSKSKALEESKKILQPNEDELLRIAELELCLFELHHEQTQRNH